MNWWECSAALMSLGVWPALPVTGHVVLKAVLRRNGGVFGSPLLNLAIAFAMGLAVWFPLLMILAAFGVYHGSWVGALGWVCILLAARDYFRSGRHNLGWPKLKPDPWHFVLLAGLAAAAFFYFVFPNEYLRGGSDPGMYSNHAVFIAREGRLSVPHPWPPGEAATFAAAYKGIPGFYFTPNAMRVQSSQFLSLWLAQAYAGAGLFGLIRFDGLVALAFLVLFHGLAGRMVSKPFAVMATLLLAFNPGQVWLARITLTENLAQLFLWGGLLVFAIGIDDGDEKAAALGGFMLGFAAFARIDGLLVLPLLLAANAADTAVRGDESKPSRRPWTWLYYGLVPTAVIATSYYAIFSSEYFKDARLFLIITAAATAVAALLLALVKSKLGHLFGQVIAGRPFFMLASFAIICVTVYAYWLRPRMGQPHVFSLQDPGLYGGRDYREYSLVNLAKYLSPLVVFGSVAAVIWLWREATKRRMLAYLPLLFVVSGYTAAFVANPTINPLHFYAIRRFMPAVIPGMLLLATWAIGRAIDDLAPRLPGRAPAAFARGAVAAYLGAMTLVGVWPLLWISANKGFYHQAGEVARLIPKDEVVIAAQTKDDDQWITPLFMSYGRRIIPLDIESNEGVNAFLSWIQRRQAEHHPVYFLTEDPMDMTGLDWKLLGTVRLVAREMERTVTPLPRKAAETNFDVSVYKISGLSSQECLGVDIGAKSHWLARESGFYDTETTGGLYSRWTNGDAKLIVPLIQRPGSLFVDLANVGPATTLELKIGGRTLFSGVIGSGEWSDSFDLNGLAFGQFVIIEIKSGTFVPSKLGTGKDNRKLGVDISDLRLFLRSSCATAVWRSKIAVLCEAGNLERGSASKAKELKVSATNMGQCCWPCVPGSPQHGPVQVGLIWIKPGPKEVRVGEIKAKLPYSVAPGETVQVILPMKAVGYDGRPLPPGRYEARIGMVHEKVAWFCDQGDPMLKFFVDVTQ